MCGVSYSTSCQRLDVSRDIGLHVIKLLGTPACTLVDNGCSKTQYQFYSLISSARNRRGKFKGGQNNDKRRISKWLRKKQNGRSRDGRPTELVYKRCDHSLFTKKCKAFLASYTLQTYRESEKWTRVQSCHLQMQVLLRKLYDFVFRVI